MKASDNYKNGRSRLQRTCKILTKMLIDMKPSDLANFIRSGARQMAPRNAREYRSHR